MENSKYELDGCNSYICIEGKESRILEFISIHQIRRIYMNVRVEDREAELAIYLTREQGDKLIEHLKMFIENYEQNS